MGLNTKSKRVRIGDIPVWGKFRRVGTHPAFGWCLRVNETRYCDAEKVVEAKAAIARFPEDPGHEIYKDLDALMALMREGDTTMHLSMWLGFYTFHDEDFARADKKDFLVPLEAP